MAKNVIHGINGPVVTVADTKDFSMQEMVYVGREKLVGEVIGVSEDSTIIQVYETTTGLLPGEEVIGTGQPMSVTLGPGILTNIFDGIRASSAENRGERRRLHRPTAAAVDALDDLPPVARHGQGEGGGLFCTAATFTPSAPKPKCIVHKCMVPLGVSGKVTFVTKDGNYAVNDRICELLDEKGNRIRS